MSIYTLVEEFKPLVMEEFNFECRDRSIINALSGVFGVAGL